MTNDELAARALERWLDQQQGTPPPPELEPDVVQAIYVLRPDLAPAPRLTADDILASVTAGPLRAPDAQIDPGPGSTAVEEGAEVVPFPQRSAPRPAPVEGTSEGESPRKTEAPQRRWLRLLGGPGGIGMALVAAATILLVATPILSPQLEQEQGIAPETVALQPAAQAPAAPPAASAPAADEPARSVEVSPNRPPVVGGLPLERATVPQKPEENALAIESRARFRDGSLIPELQEQVAAADQEAFAPEAEKIAAAAEAGAPAGAAAGAATEGVAGGEASPLAISEAELDQLRGKAAKGKSSGWRRELSSAQLSEIDQVIDEASELRREGRALEAGEKLASLARDQAYPVRALQMLCALAVEHFLAAGAPDRALGIAQFGLSLAVASSPERAQLQVAHGDALRALGDLQGAADAYRSAR